MTWGGVRSVSQPAAGALPVTVAALTPPKLQCPRRGGGVQSHLAGGAPQAGAAPSLAGRQVCALRRLGGERGECGAALDLWGLTAQSAQVVRCRPPSLGKSEQRTVAEASTASGQIAFRGEPQAGQGGSFGWLLSPGGAALAEQRRTWAAVSLQRRWCSAGAKASGSGDGSVVALQQRAIRRRATRAPR